MKRSDLIYSIGLFITIFVVYALTVAPDVSFTDSGELAGVCVHLGIAHPTGYPLFTIIGHLWTMLPLPATEIYSLNLLASLLTTLASVVFFYNIRLILNSIDEKNETSINIISLIGALSHGFALTIWEQALSIEVYCLQILLANLIIFFTLKASLADNRFSRYYLLAAFMLGLGFTNHMTTLFLIPAMIYIYFKRPGERFDFSKASFKYFLILGLPLLIALTLYIYLPLRSQAMPEYNWGWVHRSFDKFLYHFTGKQYQGWMFESWDVFWSNLGDFFSLLTYQVGWIGLLPLTIGFYAFFKMKKTVAWFFMIFFLAGVIYSSNYSIHDIALYYSMPYIGLLVFMTLGIYYIYKWKKSLLLLLFFIIPIISLSLNFNKNDRSEDYLVADYVKLVVDNLPENSVVISAQADFWLNGFLYKQSVEGYRPDIAIIEKELLRRTWYPLDIQRKYPDILKTSRDEIEEYMKDLEDFESGREFGPRRSAIIQGKFEAMLKSIISENIDDRPVYITLDVLQSERNITQGFHTAPDGMAIRMLKQGEKFMPDISHIKLDKIKKSLGERDDYLANALKNLVAVNLSNIGRYYFATNNYAKSRQAFELAISVDSQNKIAIQGLQQLNAPQN